MKYLYKIELATLKDVNKFVEIVEKMDWKVKLTDNDEYSINAKSILGTMASIEWGDLYCVSEEPIYDSIGEFVVSRGEEI